MNVVFDEPVAGCVFFGLPDVFAHGLQTGGLAVAAGFDADDVPGKLADHIAAGHPVGQAEADRLAAVVAEAQANAEEMLFGQGGNGVVRHLFILFRLKGIWLFQVAYFAADEKICLFLWLLCVFCFKIYRLNCAQSIAVVARGGFFLDKYKKIGCASCMGLAEPVLKKSTAIFMEVFHGNTNL